MTSAYSESQYSDYISFMKAKKENANKKSHKVITEYFDYTNDPYSHDNASVVEEIEKCKFDCEKKYKNPHFYNETQNNQNCYQTNQQQQQQNYIDPQMYFQQQQTPQTANFYSPQQQLPYCAAPQLMNEANFYSQPGQQVPYCPPAPPQGNNQQFPYYPNGPQGTMMPQQIAEHNFINKPQLNESKILPQPNFYPQQQQTPYCPQANNMTVQNQTGQKMPNCDENAYQNFYPQQNQPCQQTPAYCPQVNNVPKQNQTGQQMPFSCPPPLQVADEKGYPNYYTQQTPCCSQATHMPKQNQPGQPMPFSPAPQPPQMPDENGLQNKTDCNGCHQNNGMPQSAGNCGQGQQTCGKCCAKSRRPKCGPIFVPEYEQEEPRNNCMQDNIEIIKAETIYVKRDEHQQQDFQCFVTGQACGDTAKLGAPCSYGQAPRSCRPCHQKDPDPFSSQNPIIMPTIYKPLQRGRMADTFNDYHTGVKPYCGYTDNIGNPDQEYDEISKEMWADYFEDLKMQNLKESRFDYGYYDEVRNNYNPNRMHKNSVISKNRKCLDIPGTEYVKPNKVRIESKNNIFIENSRSSKKFAPQTSDPQNWPIDSFKPLNGNSNF